MRVRDLLQATSVDKNTIGGAGKDWGQGLGYPLARPRLLLPACFLVIAKLLPVASCFYPISFQGASWLISGCYLVASCFFPQLLHGLLPGCFELWALLSSLETNTTAAVNQRLNHFYQFERFSISTTKKKI